MNKECRRVMGWGTIYLVTLTKALRRTLRSCGERLCMLHAFICSVTVLFML